MLASFRGAFAILSLLTIGFFFGILFIFSLSTNKNSPKALYLLKSNFSDLNMSNQTNVTLKVFNSTYSTDYFNKCYCSADSENWEILGTVPLKRNQLEQLYNSKSSPGSYPNTIVYSMESFFNINKPRDNIHLYKYIRVVNRG